MKLLRQIPSIGPIRSALLVALIQTLHRSRTKRQFWPYIMDVRLPKTFFGIHAEELFDFEYVYCCGEV